MLCHGGFNDGWNIQEGDHAIEERSTEADEDCLADAHRIRRRLWRQMTSRDQPRATVFRSDVIQHPSNICHHRHGRVKREIALVAM